MYQCNPTRIFAFLLCLHLILFFSQIPPLQAADSALSGTVTDGAGQPLPDLELVVRQQQTDAQGQPQWQETARAVTDSQGRYTFTGLITNTYQVDLGEAARRLMVNDLIIVDDATVQSAQTTAQAALVGTVTDPKGKVAKQVAVSLYAVVTQNDYGYDHLIRRTLTDDQGRYKFGNLSAGQYKVGFADVNYPERYVAEYYPDMPDLGQATPIYLAGSQRQMDVQLALAGLIAGRVTDQAGQTLAGIQVALFRYNDNYWQWVNSTATFNDGSYTFSGLVAGDYRIGYRDGRWPALYAPEFYNNAATLESATDIALAAGATVADIGAQLAAASQVVGLVTDQDGHPIEGINVNLYHDPDGDGVWLPIEYAGRTDTTGAYQITGLAAGVYRLGFTDGMSWPLRYHAAFYNDATTLETATDLTVGTGVIVSGIDAQLLTTSHIQGQVTDENGQPLVNTLAILYGFSGDGYWHEMSRTATDAAGFYDLGGLVAGNYRLGFAYTSNDQPVEYYADAARVEDAADIAVGANATVANINAQLPAPGAIAGVVTGDAGQALANISVSAWRQVANPVGMTDWFPVTSTRTEANGAYQLPNLAAGRYRLEFGDSNNWPRRYSTEYYNDAPMLADAADITVIAGVTSSSIDAQLGRVGSISGQVVDPAGNPLEKIIVVALRRLPDGMGNTFWGEVTAASTNAAGDYTLTGLDVGAYRIVFRDSLQSARYATEYYDNVVDRQNAVDIAVTAGAQVTAINAQMATGSQISGRVTGEQGEALEHIFVMILRAAVDDAGNPIWENYAGVTTQADGSYTFAGLAVGRYRIGFTDWSGVHYPEFYDNAVAVEDATDIQVAGQQVVTAINAQLGTQPVTPVVPQARNDKVTITGDRSQLGNQIGVLNLLANDSDPNGDALTLRLVAGAQHGTVTLHPDGSFAYTPASQSVIMSDRFTYAVSDGVYRSNVATVEIELAIAPLANPLLVWIPVVSRK